MVNKLQELIYSSIVSTARGQSHPIESIGSIHFETPNGVIKTIDNVLYVPRFDNHLLFVRSMATIGYLIVFHDKSCLIIHKSDPKIVVFGNHMTNDI
jgi:hypothetical protein